MQHRLMVLPMLACPASCVYCFGPRKGGPRMGRETLEALVGWQKALAWNDGPLEITFHGGEPLTAGAGFYRLALPLLRDGLAPREVRFGLQSNLWLLTDELCELFLESGVSIGTSLDGPEEINDAQRGAGHFRRTMAGVERARAHGLEAGCICTFTARSAARAEEVFDFFRCEGLGFSIHAALPPLGRLGDGWALPPEDHGQLLVGMLDRYLAHADKVRIGTLDAMSRSVSAGRGGICTFVDCLGEYLAVDPQGFIYPCQRFVDMPRFRLGNVRECPSLQALAEAPAWRLLAERQAQIEEECGDCPHFDYCRGGCPYNALARNGGGFDTALRDPHCPAYRQAFDAIAERALQEVFSDENLAAVVEEGPGRYGLMRKGKLISIMRDGPHPQKVARRAREVVAAVSLAVSASPEKAQGRLERAGIVTQPDAALASLRALRHRLDTQSERTLLNAYLHVTYACDLRCSHCYAGSQTGKSRSMPVEDIARLVRELAQAGFRKAVVTGGEPLAHPQRERLLDEVAALRLEVKPLEIVLRTNLTRRLTPALARQLISSTDHVIVSVDGDEAAHDGRRGTGSYARTVANLRALASLASQTVVTSGVPPAQVSIAAALDAPQMDGAEAEAVRDLGEELGLPVRLKPLLPLGRAASHQLTPEFYSSLDDGAEALSCGKRVAASCGLGMNLYLGPGGECFPCYALTGARHGLGNALTDGLVAVLRRNDAYRRVTVGTNERCRACALRYLCGGLCRAWSAPGDSPNAAPANCSALHWRARYRLLGALATLNVPPERWLAAGLPLPETPPNRG